MKDFSINNPLFVIPFASLGFSNDFVDEDRGNGIIIMTGGQFLPIKRGTIGASKKKFYKFEGIKASEIKIIVINCAVTVVSTSVRPSK